MNWLSKGLSDSVCARILAVCILMLIGGIVGWGIFTCLSQPLTAGRMDSAPMLDCLYNCLILPFVTILIGPLVIGAAIGMLLFGPGSGMLGLMLLLALSGLQYVLLVVAKVQTDFKCRTFPFEWGNPDFAEVCLALVTRSG